MSNILLFIKDFELGAKVSTVCVDYDCLVKFTDEDTSPDEFSSDVNFAIVDLDESVFSSVGLVSELKRHGLKVIGTMGKVKNKEQSKLKLAGCDIILPKSSLVKNLPSLFKELKS